MNADNKHPHQDILTQYLANTELLIESEVPHYNVPGLSVFLPVTPEEVIGDLAGTLKLRLTEIEREDVEIDEDLLQAAKRMISSWPDDVYFGVSTLQRKLCISYMEASVIILHLQKMGFIFKKIELNGWKVAGTNSL